MNKRPKNLNLLSVKFPLSAIMSVGHRAAGILLFVIIPYVLYLLQMSLNNQAGFELVQDKLHSPLAKLFAVILIWALVHHFLAGIRYFLLDIDVGIKKQYAQKSALLVMIASFIIAFLFLLFFFL